MNSPDLIFLPGKRNFSNDRPHQPQKIKAEVSSRIKCSCELTSVFGKCFEIVTIATNVQYQLPYYRCIQMLFKDLGMGVDQGEKEML